MRILISIIGIGAFILIGLFMLINVPQKPQLIPPIQDMVLPTYGQVFKFIGQDNTDKNISNSEYNCLDYAGQLKESANANGLKCAVVVLGLELQGVTTVSHAIVCFDTQDRGRIYFDPQNDVEVFNVVVGADYKYGYYVLKITKVTFIW